MWLNTHKHTIQKNPLWFNLGWTSTFIMVSSTLLPSYISPIFNLPTHPMWFPTSLPNPLDVLITHPLQPFTYLHPFLLFLFFFLHYFHHQTFQACFAPPRSSFHDESHLRSTFLSNGVFKCNLETRNKVENLFDSLNFFYKSN